MKCKKQSLKTIYYHEPEPALACIEHFQSAKPSGEKADVLTAGTNPADAQETD